jgi:hypothetical protein
MGGIFSKSKLKLNKNVELIVSSTGYIMSASPMFLMNTGYEYKDIHQKHLADVLLTGVLARLHKNIFIPKFKNATGKEKARLRNFIKNHKKNIRCTISTPKGLQKVFVSIREISNDDLCVTFICCRNTELTVGTTVKDNIPPLLRDCPLKTTPTLVADDVGIISMDLHGSTAYINEMGVGPYVASQKLLFNELQRHLEVELFPLVQLHEVLGDSFIMTVNSPWWCRSRLHEMVPFKLMVAKYLTHHLNKICDEFFNGKIYIRCGIADGSVVANITGRYFRLYGQCINIACRLEGLCKRDHVHMLDKGSSVSYKLKGFDGVFNTSQISTLICPTMSEICDLVEERNAFMGPNDSRTKSYNRSKHVFSTEQLASTSSLLTRGSSKYSVPSRAFKSNLF